MLSGIYLHDKYRTIHCHDKNKKNIPKNTVLIFICYTNYCSALTFFYFKIKYKGNCLHIFVITPPRKLNIVNLIWWFLYFYNDKNVGLYV